MKKLLRRWFRRPRPCPRTLAVFKTLTGEWGTVTFTQAVAPAKFTAIFHDPRGSVIWTMPVSVLGVRSGEEPERTGDITAWRTEGWLHLLLVGTGEYGRKADIVVASFPDADVARFKRQLAKAAA